MPSILEPLSFRTGLRAPNRVVLAAMTNQQSHADGTISRDEHDWLTSRARGGFGTVTTCASHVAKDGQGWRGELGIFDDAQLPGLTTLAADLRAAGATSFMQLFHGGLRADPQVSGSEPWSAVVGPTWRAGTTAEIERVVVQFGDAAVRASKAGFDGVELHGAHGYLLCQFLASDNQRTDGWGEALEGRARLVREVTREVRRRTPAGFTVMVRLSPEDFAQAKGLDLDESLQTASWLAEDGADGIHISLWKSLANTKKRPEQHAITLFREALPADVRLIAAGSIWTRAEAESLLERGVDAVALGRSAIVNPDWPRRIVDPSWTPDRPPVTVEQLRARGIGASFAEYMRNWKGFIA